MMSPAASASREIPDRWVVPRGNVASGMIDGITLREGFGIVRADLTYSEDSEYCYQGSEYLKFQCKLSGNTSIASDGRDFLSVEPGQVMLIAHPEECWKRERISQHTHSRSVTLMCSRGFAESFLVGAMSNLPSGVADFLSGKGGKFALTSRPLTLAQRVIVEDILRTPLSAPIHRLALEGKALELLCETVGYFGDPSLERPALRERDVRKVEDLCAYLEENPGSTLAIRELCRLFAWNQTQMIVAFKQVTGITISAYRHRLRMRLALRQLQETEISITEIAFAAGFEHPSNFTNAFRRTFGMSPRDARSLRGTQVTLERLVS